MKQINSQVLIIGTGLIGLITSYCLLRQGYKIVIVEKNNIFKQKIGSLNDIRTVAIAEGSKLFLNKIGIWKKIKHFAQPINKIDVIDRSPLSKIDFINNKQKNLGYIIKNSIFHNILLKELIKEKKLTILDNSFLYEIQYAADKVVGCSNKYRISSDLLIAADGKNSSIRKMLSTPIFKKAYPEKALVLNFTHKENHQNTAYEFFYKNGPMAILPMKKTKNQFCSSMVWSNKPDFLESLFNSNNNFIKEYLNDQKKLPSGKIINVISKQLFPLSAHINSRFYEKRVIYIGDSAHSIHPIAGQGWNLGLRDIIKLNKLISEQKKFGIPLGAENFCENYNSSLYFDTFEMYQITDKLNWLFKNNFFILNLFRKTGFNIINDNNKLKNKITKFAMGF